MGRKSKQAGGHMPLTHYERTKKFASSEYGTIEKRLAGHSQYQIGYCALTVTKLNTDNDDNKDSNTYTTTALCSPSGYIYNESSILEFLLQKTQELKRQRNEYEEAQQKKKSSSDEESKKRLAAFEESQKVVKKLKTDNDDDKKTSTSIADKKDLKRVSYWLADSQPDTVDTSRNDGSSPPPERPSSPMSGDALRRKDLWPISLQWQDNKLQCSVSHKTIQNGAGIIAYWTDKKCTQPGMIVLQSVYDDIIIKKDSKSSSMRCPITDKKIKYIRILQKGGSSFATGNQQQKQVAQKYRPTIT